MAVPRTLHVLLMGEPMAILKRGDGGRLSLTYAPSWQGSEGAHSLSLSLPYTQADHTHRPVLSYISNLLPDNQAILDGWGAQFGVSSRNAFGLLAHMGEDCAGAVQFVRGERLDAVLHAPTGVDPLTDADVEEALARVRRDVPPWPEAHETQGMFSLPGAQAKIALVQVDDAWARPTGRAASTHIFKPPAIGRFPGIETNEHVCLGLARRLGIPAAASRVVRFGAEIAIVVERFDRLPGEDGARRLHQEDTCQVLGLPPSRKYEYAGGPGFAQMAEIARLHSADPEADLLRVLAAAAFNLIIGGSDAHAKNYSWFLTIGDRVRMTPLYDLISSFPYYNIADGEARLAMSIGGENQFLYVSRQQWARLADALAADAADVVGYVRDLAARTPDALAKVVARSREEGLDGAVLDVLADEIVAQARRIVAWLS